jgi:hypothetical protein
VLFYVFLFLFVLCYVLFVCDCVLPPGDNPIAVNKYNNNNKLVTVTDSTKLQRTEWTDSLEESSQVTTGSVAAMT